jgi:hypothetical protein
VKDPSRCGQVRSARLALPLRSDPTGLPDRDPARLAVVTVVGQAGALFMARRAASIATAFPAGRSLWCCGPASLLATQDCSALRLRRSTLARARELHEEGRPPTPQSAPRPGGRTRERAKVRSGRTAAPQNGVSPRDRRGRTSVQEDQASVSSSAPRRLVPGRSVASTAGHRFAGDAIAESDLLPLNTGPRSRIRTLRRQPV